MRTLLTEDEARDAIGGLSPIDADDQRQWLTDAVNALTPVIEHYAGPVILRSETTYLTGGRSTIVLPWAPAQILTVAIDGVPVDPLDYYGSSDTGIIGYGRQGRTSSTQWPGGAGSIAVTALVGYEETPANILLAAKELIRFWWQQGHQGNLPWGQSDQGEFRVPQGFTMPNRVIALIQSGANQQLPGFA